MLFGQGKHFQIHDGIKALGNSLSDIERFRPDLTKPYQTNLEGSRRSRPRALCEHGMINLGSLRMAEDNGCVR
jgi:hypothetical protein